MVDIYDKRNIGRPALEKWNLGKINRIERYES